MGDQPSLATLVNNTLDDFHFDGRDFTLSVERSKLAASILLALVTAGHISRDTVMGTNAN